MLCCFQRNIFNPLAIFSKPSCSGMTTTFYKYSPLYNICVELLNSYFTISDRKKQDPATVMVREINVNMLKNTVTLYQADSRSPLTFGDSTWSQGRVVRSKLKCSLDCTLSDVCTKVMYFLQPRMFHIKNVRKHDPKSPSKNLKGVLRYSGLYTIVPIVLLPRCSHIF